MRHELAKAIAHIARDEAAFQTALDALCLEIETTEEAQALRALLPSLRQPLTAAYIAGLRDGQHRRS